MAEQPKKFTFGFSKVTKKSLLAPAPKSKQNAVQFIDCLEGNSIKLIHGEEKKNEPIVIPIIGPAKSSTVLNGKSIAEIAEDFSSISDGASKAQSAVPEIAQSLPSDSLDALAAKEILQGANEVNNDDGTKKLDTLPALDPKDKEELQKESTLEDYENIPVSQFGLAMLRGMGWKQDEGIGKNNKVVAVAAPQVRPKGMGLGADKVSLGNTPNASSSKKGDGEEDLKLTKGAFVKVLGGSYRNQYAQVEGFNDDSGRVILKMAIGGFVATVIEAAIQLVTKSEYSKNSKVLNATKYDEFKKREENADGKNISSKDCDENDVILESKMKKQDYSPKRKFSQSPVHKFKKERSSSGDEEYVSTQRIRKSLSRSRSPVKSGLKERSSSSLSTALTSDKRKYVSSQKRRKSLSRSRSPVKSSHKKRSSRSLSRSLTPDKREYVSTQGRRKSRSRSRSPVKNRHNKRSSRSLSRSLTPDKRRSGKLSSKKYESDSPNRSKRKVSPSKSKKKSTHSHSNKKKKTSRNRSSSSSSRSTSHSPSPKRNKKKKKRERRDSSTEPIYRRPSRSVTPKKKSKGEKKRRSHTRSPSSRRRKRQ